MFQSDTGPSDKVLLVLGSHTMGDQLVSIESAKKTGYWHEVINNPPDSVMRAAYTAYHKAAAREATMETKDVWGGMPGLR
jgi:hypothetical protein